MYGTFSIMIIVRIPSNAIRAGISSSSGDDDDGGGCSIVASGYIVLFMFMCIVSSLIDRMMVT